MENNQVGFAVQIDKLNEVLNKALYIRNIPETTLRLVFLKYVIDNCIGASSGDEMRFYMKAQRMFFQTDFRDGREILVGLFDNLDQYYHLMGVLSSRQNVDEYDRILFGAGNDSQRKGTGKASSLEILSCLGVLNLEDNNIVSFGPDLAMHLAKQLSEGAGKNNATAEYTSRSDLSKLVKALLKVSDNDTFYDFAAGAGISTLIITEHCHSKIIHTDVNKKANSLAAMLYIIAGKRGFIVRNDDYLESDSTSYIDYRPCSSNKMFIDPPLGLKVSKPGEDRKTDSCIFALDKMIHEGLTSEGMGIIACPGGVLFSTTASAMSLREEIVSLGLLKAVIALPPMWNRTSIGTNLIIISKEPTWNTTFVDATKLAANVRCSRNMAAILDDASISKIVDAVNNAEDILGFSINVRNENIRAKDFNIVPAAYLDIVEEDDGITLAQLDNELAELYKKLV